MSWSSSSQTSSSQTSEVSETSEVLPGGKWPLPEGWEWTRLGAHVWIRNGYAFSSKDYVPTGILLVRQANLNGNTIDVNKAVFLPLDYLQRYGDYLVEKGDVLIGLSGSIGKLCVYNLGQPALQNQRTGLLRISTNVSPVFVRYFLETLVVFLQEQAKGVAVQNISTKQIEGLDFPLPPIDEQHRIVAEIEKQFTRLDAAVAALKRAKANLARYKAAVLKAAVEGRLVAQDPDDEPAAALLARILAERRAQWEAANPKKKYVEPKRPDVAGLPELPVGWVWATWEQLSPRVTVGHVGPMKDEYINNGIPFLRSQNVRENRFEREGLAFISESFHRKLSKSRLSAGDLVVVRSGSVGVTCAIPEELGEANCSDLVIIQRSPALLPLYGAYFMNSAAKRRVREGQVGVALIHFNTKSVAALPVALPPLAEQSRIVEEVERRLSVTQATEQAIDANLARAERLRQGVLGKAFRGELVTSGDSETSEVF